jgi:hypothetical protein
MEKVMARTKDGFQIPTNEVIDGLDRSQVTALLSRLRQKRSQLDGPDGIIAKSERRLRFNEKLAERIPTAISYAEIRLQALSGDATPMTSEMVTALIKAGRLSAEVLAQAATAVAKNKRKD